jgi:predicted AlkP superfamily phosphohydrolase/phosphomutase
MFRRKGRRRLALIGLDCAEPTLLFDRFAADLPAIGRLRARGLWGTLESVIPAITVPAWSCMMSGQDPGALGIYGFRNRADYRYDRLVTANSDAVMVPRLWDILSRHGKRSIVLNVPGTYPPRPLNGQMISCFLTPNPGVDYTYPSGLKAELEARVGTYPFDATDFRTHDKARLLREVTDMTRTHFEAARWLTKRQDWDLFAFVEIGLDRMQHAFWSFMDPLHKDFVEASPFANAIRDYYVFLDDEIDRLLHTFDDDTAVLIVSDHGARRMDGGVAINEWLIQQGYLRLNGPYPTAVTRPDMLDIDWSSTMAWGEGGYYGRLFLNIAGREPQGIVKADAVNALLDEIASSLTAMTGPGGPSLGTRCFRPEQLYSRVEGIPPDLLVYFGDLAWRSLGSVGWGRTLVLENDTGPDDANHAQQGVVILDDPADPGAGRELRGAHLLQIAPTLLRHFGIAQPGDMHARPLG